MADQWGANSTNQTKPTWEYLTGQRGRLGTLANVFATPQGWVQRHAWGDEILVATSADLSAVFGPPVITMFEIVTLGLSNSQTTNVVARMVISEPVSVNGTPTLLAIKSGGSTGNLVLSYVAGASDPGAGYLIFANTTPGALGNCNATINGVVIGAGSFTFKVNATSTFQGDKIVDGEEYAAGNLTPGNVSTTFANAYAQTITIAAYKPGLTPDAPAGILAGAQPHPAAAQTVSWTVQFNEAVTVTGVPTMVMIGTGGAVNATVSFSNALSNVANGTMIFTNAALDLTGDNSLSFVLNSTSVLTGWSGIVGVTSGNTTVNTLGFSSNTRTIAAT